MNFKKSIEVIKQGTNEFFKDKKKAQTKLISIGGVLASTLVAAQFLLKSDKDAKKMYVAELKTPQNKTIDIYDDENKIIETIDKNSIDEYYIITMEDENPQDEMQHVAIVSQNGTISSGYIDEKYIDKKSKEVIDSFSDKNEFNDIAVVSAPDGAWVRQNKTIDKHTQNAQLLESGTYVLAGLSETSKDNAYTWKEIIYSEGDKFKVGYIASEYLLDIDFEKNDNTLMRVATDGLKMRSGASTNNEILKVLNEDNEVVVIKNVYNFANDQHDWLYVANKDENGEIQLGWCAATERDEYGNEYKHLELKECKPEIKTENIEEDITQATDEEQEIIEQENKPKDYISKIVDTSEDGGVDLNLRESPGMDSNKIAKIENGTKIIVTTKEIENTMNVDDRNWLHICLEDGMEGWVAEDYLKDYTNENKKSTKRTLDIHYEKNVEGYVGIDVSISDAQQLATFLEKPGYDNSQIPILENNIVPNFVYIKLASTGWGDDFSFVYNDIESRKEEIKKLADVCEKNKIPFGFYYYSQSTTDSKSKSNIYFDGMVENEAEKEEEHICNLMSDINTGNYKYNVLPFAYDVENAFDGSSETGRHITFQNCFENSEEAKKELTRVKNGSMTRLRELLGQDIVLYTNHNILKNMMNYEELDEENKKLWAVDKFDVPSHSEDLVSLIPNKSNIKNRQLALDAMTNDGWLVDIDFMSAEAFEKYTEGLDLGYDKK